MDTNVLLLYLVGLYDVQAIARFKRTRQYTSEEFQFVASYAGHFRCLITTPCILAELSNLSPRGKEPRLAMYYGQLVTALKAAEEQYVGKDVILDSPLLPRIGFTDLSIIEAAKRDKRLVLTDDLPLAEYLRRSNCDVINFNHIRGEMWFRG